MSQYESFQKLAEEFKENLQLFDQEELDFFRKLSHAFSEFESLQREAERINPNDFSQDNIQHMEHLLRRSQELAQLFPSAD